MVTLDTEQYFDEHCEQRTGTTLEVEHAPDGVRVKVSWSRLRRFGSHVAEFELSRTELEQMLGMTDGEI